MAQGSLSNPAAVKGEKFIVAYRRGVFSERCRANGAGMERRHSLHASLYNRSKTIKRDGDDTVTCYLNEADTENSELFCLELPPSPGKPSIPSLHCFDLLTIKVKDGDLIRNFLNPLGGLGGHSATCQGRALAGDERAASFPRRSSALKTLPTAEIFESKTAFWSDGASRLLGVVLGIVAGRLLRAGSRNRRERCYFHTSKDISLHDSSAKAHPFFLPSETKVGTNGWMPVTMGWPDSNAPGDPHDRRLPKERVPARAAHTDPPPLMLWATPIQKFGGGCDTA
ncbi:hypothetical protein C8R43DRAFT_1109702 [Mycena crocata]|nr:hypothetical protein C8R43DRAFT_1109702 [Mycena crocata]